MARVPEAFGAIVVAKSMGDRLYIVAEHGISSGVLADQIDPARENINIPQFVQRDELNYGTEDGFVQRTLCAALELLNPAHLPNGFDQERAVTLALKTAQELGALRDTISELQGHHELVAQRAGRGEVRRDHLPHTPNLRGRVRQAIGHLRDAQLAAIGMAEMFYPKARANLAWQRSLKGAVREQLGADDPAVADVERAANTLCAVADARNAIIHPDLQKWATVVDYDLAPNGALVRPTIEIVHPDSPVPRVDAVAFLEGAMEDVIGAFETFLVVFCDRNRRDHGPRFQSRVVLQPEGQKIRGSPFVWETRIAEGELLADPGDANPDGPG